MSITAEDVMSNPEKYGVPTFDQFNKNPDKYKDTLSKKLGRVDKSSHIVKHLIEKQTYKIRGYECKTLEELERIAKNEGVDLMKCKLRPQIIPTIAGKCQIIVELHEPVYSPIMDRLGNFFRRK